MPTIPLILPGSPPVFPNVHEALTEPDGLLAAGGDLSTERLLEAYRRGIFPWFEEGEEILWWAPNPRAVLLPEEFNCSRSLAKVIRSNRFDISVNQDFAGVIDQCAGVRATTGTWITDGMRQAYVKLHEHGYAYSVEAWQDNALVGGLYGVRLGSIFFGESMFSTVSNASKVALAKLISLCKDSKIPLIDCQQSSGHLARLGSRLIQRADFTERLQQSIDTPPCMPEWSQPPTPSAACITIA